MDHKMMLRSKNARSKKEATKSKVTDKANSQLRFPADSALSDSSEFLSDNPRVPSNAHSQVTKNASKDKDSMLKNSESTVLPTDKDIDSLSGSSSESADEDVLLNTEGAIIDLGEIQNKNKRKSEQIIQPQKSADTSENIVIENPVVEEEEREEDNTLENTIDGGHSTDTIRFGIPNEYTTYKFTGQKHPWLEDIDGKELWLIKAPHDYDMSKFDGKAMTIGGSMILEKETVDDTSYVWEIHATQSNALKNSNWCAFLPSKQDKKLRPAGPLLGQMSLSKNIQPKPVVIPESEPGRLALPAGLKMRHIPFGIASSKKRRNERRQSRKDKKSRLSSDI